jgi:hypothetical protein
MLPISLLYQFSASRASNCCKALDSMAIIPKMTGVFLQLQRLVSERPTP